MVGSELELSLIQMGTMKAHSCTQKLLKLPFIGLARTITNVPDFRHTEGSVSGWFSVSLTASQHL